MDGDRERTLALLEANHTFPGEYGFRVVTKPGHRPAVVSAVRAAGGEGLDIIRVGERPSRKGNWVSVHVDVTVQSAEVVVAVYEVLASLDGVVMTM